MMRRMSELAVVFFLLAALLSGCAVVNKASSDTFGVSVEKARFFTDSASGTGRIIVTLRQRGGYAAFSKDGTAPQAVMISEAQLEEMNGGEWKAVNATLLIYRDAVFPDDRTEVHLINTELIGEDFHKLTPVKSQSYRIRFVLTAVYEMADSSGDGAVTESVPLYYEGIAD